MKAVDVLVIQAYNSNRIVYIEHCCQIRSSKSPSETVYVTHLVSLPGIRHETLQRPECFGSRMHVSAPTDAPQHEADVTIIKHSSIITQHS